MARKPPPPGKGRVGPNKLTKTVKEAFEVAFNELQGDPDANLADWARANPGDFYKIASKMIPADTNLNVGPIEITVKRAGT